MNPDISIRIHRSRVHDSNHVSIPGRRPWSLVDDTLPVVRGSADPSGRNIEGRASRGHNKGSSWRRISTQNGAVVNQEFGASNVVVAIIFDRYVVHGRMLELCAMCSIVAVVPSRC